MQCLVLTLKLCKSFVFFLFFFLVCLFVLSILNRFRFVGPAPSNGTNCYPDGPLDNTWACNCVIRQFHSECTLQDAVNTPLFPWGWQETGSLFTTQSQINSYCTASPSPYTLVDPDPALTPDDMIATSGAVFSTLTSWTTFLQYFCTHAGQLMVPDPVTGKRVRVTSDSFNSFTDLDLNDRNGTSFCHADPLELLSLTDNRFRLSYNVYQYWAHAYEVSASLLFPAWEKMIYGTIIYLDQQIKQFDYPNK